MSFINKVFDALVGLSEKLPAIDIGSFYIVVLAAIAAFGIVVGLTFIGSRAGKLRRACRRIIGYLDNVNVVDDDNVAEFTAVCFGSGAPVYLRESWLQFMGVRFGYPSDVLSESAVFDREVKRFDNIRSSVFIAIALFVVALFTFWGLGCMRPSEVGVVMCLGLLLTALVYIILCSAAKRQYKYARDAFREMQDELDAKVNLQIDKDYATDASPLLEIATIVDGIVAKNTARPYPQVTEADVFPAAAQAPVETVPAEGEELSGTADETEVADTEETTEEEQSPEAAEDAVDGEQPEDAEPADAAQANESERADDTQAGAEAAEEQSDGTEEETPEESAEATDAEEMQEDASFRYAVDDDGVGKPENENKNDQNFFALEEINDEDEENMFGRKKKQAQQEELNQQGYGDLYVESEPVADDEVVDTAAATAEEQQEAFPHGNGVKPESLEGLNVSIRPTAASSVTVSLEPEIIYVEEDLDEGDEDVKAPRLAKLPHLVDFVLTMKISRGMKIRVAMLMLQAYNVFKNSPENKAIVIQCLKKIMQALIADQMAAKAAAEKAQAEAAAATEEPAQA